MGIEEQLTAALKQAMRDKRPQEVSVIRMVKTMAAKDKTSADFDGNTGDEFWLAVIARYVKQQKKALAELEKLGEAAQTQVEEAKFEIDYLAPYLPQLMSEEETAVLVDKTIQETGAAGGKMVGRVVGAVMKEHRDKVDPAIVKRIAAQKLG